MRTATTELDWMTRSDYPGVVALNWQPGVKDVISLSRLARLMRMKHVMGYVARIDGQVVGYAVRELHVAHRQLVALVVANEYQRQGIGSRLLREVARRNNGQIARVVATVRESSLPAHLFLKENGFRARRVYREWFQDKEDAYEFIREGSAS